MTDSAIVPGKDKRELLRRTSVGVALVVLALGTLWLKGYWFWGLVSIMALLMQREWGNLVGRTENVRLSQYALSVPLAIMSPLAAGPSWLALGLIGGAFAFTAAIDRSFRLAAGIFYVGIPVLALMYLLSFDSALIALWTLALVWATDIGAYFFGRMIGGPKLAPRLSPNKTWAGLIGGMVTALALGIFLYYFFDLSFRFALASAPLAIVAQGGDLFESWMKRRAGIKNSGSILPGHGGVLDRFDGLVPVAPCVALLSFVGPI